MAPLFVPRRDERRCGRGIRRRRKGTRDDSFFSRCANADSARLESRLTRVAYLASQFLRWAVAQNELHEVFRQPLMGMEAYLVGVGVALFSFHVFAIFTLARRTMTKDGVSAWYGFVLGAMFYLTWVMVGQGILTHWSNEYFRLIEATVTYEVASNQTLSGGPPTLLTFEYSEKNKQSVEALMVMSFMSVAANVLTFLYWLLWRNAICGDTPPRVGGAASQPRIKAASPSTASSKFQATPLNEASYESSSSPAASRSLEMGGGGGSSLRFGADRFKS
jgi:hypothetical protein